MWSKSARRHVVRLLAAALTVAALGVGAAGAGQDPAPDASDLVNALLSGLLGFRPATEEELRHDVEQVGGVPFRDAVPFDYLTPKELTRYLEELLDDEYPPARARADERTLRGFDLLPGGSELREQRRRLLLDNVVGFYDDRPGRRRLYAVSLDRTLTPTNQLVLAHELRHALQDQHMSIHGLLNEGVSDFDDRRLALLSLLEGDATLVMERFLARRLGREAGALSEGLALPEPELPGTPGVLRDQLLAPYLAGLHFVRQLERSGGWPAVLEAWQHPPRSMEQVLHPEKYLAREEPMPVRLQLAPADGQLIAQGVLGEVLVRTLLDGDAAGADGWGGDGYQTWDVRGKTLLAWRSLWDAESERREFGRALSERFTRRLGRARSAQTPGWTVFSGAGWHFAIADAPGAVSLLSSDDPGVLEKAVAEITAGQSGP